MSERLNPLPQDDGLAAPGGEPQARVAFVVHGHVQGVGYRAFARHAARALELSGFVRNEWDRTVCGQAAGSKSALEALRVALDRGPVFGRVSRLDWSPHSEGESLPFPFEIRP
jgi:acylphosphatase